MRRTILCSTLALAVGLCLGAWLRPGPGPSRNVAAQQVATDRARAAFAARPDRWESVYTYAQELVYLTELQPGSLDAAAELEALVDRLERLPHTRAQAERARFLRDRVFQPDPGD